MVKKIITNVSGKMLAGATERAVKACNMCNGDHDTERTIVLHKFKVDAILLESVQNRLNEMLPYLLQDGVYTWQEILGEDFWLDMAMPRHLPMLCLRHLAQQPGSHLRVPSWSGPDATFFELN